MHERTRSMGHSAPYYWPGQETAARSLMTDLGSRLVGNGPAPGRDGFCTALELDYAFPPFFDRVPKF